MNPSWVSTNALPAAIRLIGPQSFGPGPIIKQVIPYQGLKGRAPARPRPLCACGVAELRPPVNSSPIEGRVRRLAIEGRKTPRAPLHRILKVGSGVLTGDLLH